MKIKCSLVLYTLIITIIIYKSNEMNGRIIEGTFLNSKEKSILVKEEMELDKYLKSFLLKLKENKINSNKLKEKGVSGKQLKKLIEQYLNLKRIKDKPREIHKTLEHNITDYSWMLRFKTRKGIINKIDKNELINHMSPLNSTAIFNSDLSNIPINNLNESIILVKNNTSSIFYSQIIQDSNNKDIVNKPASDCIDVKEWSYQNHGDDWPCICNSGNYQSPIDLLEKKSKKIILNSKIFFDFKFPEISSNDDIMARKLPLIRNIGTALEIEIDCGVAIMPSHMNGYKCFKIQIHTPSEHKIESKSADMEIQIYFKLKDKHIVDKTTRDYLVIVILVKGIEEDHYNLYEKRSIKTHPFIDLLEVDKLPVSKGLARLLSKNINLNLIFDKSKQPFKLKNISTNKENDKFLNQNIVLKAINDFVYDKHYPLTEYFLYNGSFTTPPCNENVTYIVIPDAIFTKMQQIIVIA